MSPSLYSELGPKLGLESQVPNDFHILALFCCLQGCAVSLVTTYSTSFLESVSFYLFPSLYLFSASSGNTGLSTLLRKQLRHIKHVSELPKPPLKYICWNVCIWCHSLCQDILGIAAHVQTQSNTNTCVLMHTHTLMTENTSQSFLLSDICISLA